MKRAKVRAGAVTVDVPRARSAQLTTGSRSQLRAPAAVPQGEMCLVCGVEASEEAKVKLGRVYARMCPQCSQGVVSGLTFLSWLMKR